jgi:mannosyltransferase OCH1-like enzyme
MPRRIVSSLLRAYRRRALTDRKVRNREAHWLQVLPEFAGAGPIPRLIHQIYPTRDLPSPLNRNVEAIKAANPGWEHRLYDEDSGQAFIGEHYGELVLELYRRIDSRYGAARGDLARYLIVYALGGVYLDIKSYFDRPIASVIGEGDGYVLAQWDNRAEGHHPGYGLHPDLADLPRGEFQQWHVIAAPMHPFLRAVIAKVLANIETYRPWRHGVGRNGVFRVTGPIAYTQAIQPILDRHPHRLLADPAEVGLSYSIGDGYKHMAAFPKHYSLQTTPVVRIPAWAMPAAKIYGRIIGSA